jgi:protein-S-isoprenylcysteine O-methyltransferase Ste14
MRIGHHRAGSDASSGSAPRLVPNRRWHARLFLLILVPPIALTEPAWPEGGLVREALQWSGYVAIVICVLGRAWCATYIAGRKSRELVDHGPYSVVRNPLYGFSLAGLAGVGLSTGSITRAALLLLGSSASYRFVVGREESGVPGRIRTIHGKHAALDTRPPPLAGRRAGKREQRRRLRPRSPSPPTPRAERS